MSDAFEKTTNVRFHRPRLWGLLAILPLILVAVFVTKFTGALFLLFPVPFVFLLANRVTEARVVASAEGLRVGSRLVPREAFKRALVRHEGETTYVALKGRANVDVEVSSNVEADALLEALRLDAASAAAEFPLADHDDASFAVVLGMLLASFVLFRLVPSAPAFFAVLAVGTLLLAALRIARHVTLRVGADGIVVRRALRRERFVPHDAIRDIHAEGRTIVIERSDGHRFGFDVPIKTGERTPAPPDDDEANAIVRRIHQARRAFQEGKAAPELSALLGRGSRTTREWLAELRRLGEGAASTFRTIGVAREQLFDVVESTTARATDRIAALIALRATLREQDKPRVRVAADRIAAPELRERMVRILEIDEAELEGTLDELESPEPPACADAKTKYKSS